MPLKFNRLVVRSPVSLDFGTKGKGVFGPKKKNGVRLQFEIEFQ